MSDYTRDEMMTVAAARLLADGQVCFVGIGLPSAACNLARLTHAPELVLIYESGTIGTRPNVLPLSIGDGELAETATCVIPLPDVFSDYLQAGRIDIGFLGAAQIDCFGNLNSTVIGSYEKPKTRLPGAGGATEIAAHARQVFHRHEGDAAQLRAKARLPDERRAFHRPCAKRRPRRRAIGDRHRRRYLETAAGKWRIRAFRGLSREIPAEDAKKAVGWPLAVLPLLETCAAPTLPELRRASRARVPDCRGAPRTREDPSMNAEAPTAAGSIKNPHIRMDLPGPKSRAMIERDTKVASPSYPRDYPFVISHGKGTEAWDVDGNRFLDFAAGIAVCATGHAHTRAS